METTTNYRVENNTLKTVITTVETRVSESSVDLDFLYAQKTNIENQKEDQKKLFEIQMQTRDAEIKQVDDMIAECIKKGLKTSAEIEEERAKELAIKEEAERVEQEKTRKAEEKKAKKLAEEEAERLAQESANNIVDAVEK